MPDIPPTKESSSILSRIKSITVIVQSVFTIGAIIVAGIWFFVQREAEVKANIDQKVTHRQITKDWTWVHVSVTISNQGKRFLDLESGVIRIQRILPLEKKIKDKIMNNQDPIVIGTHNVGKVSWLKLCEPYEPKFKVGIEPGEVDKVNCEFIIPAFIHTVKIYCHIDNKQSQGNGWTSKMFSYLGKKQNQSFLGWTATTIYDTHAQK